MFFSGDRYGSVFSRGGSSSSAVVKVESRMSAEENEEDAESCEGETVARVKYFLESEADEAAETTVEETGYLFWGMD